ncbi:MAG: YitT family protein [Bacillota bacterium]|nr:YitT family protein [Bacillota bacterium]
MRRKLLYDYAAILLGAVLTALGLDLFLVPNRIAAGGVSGLATVIHYWTGAGVGFIMLLINLPLLWASLRMLGHEFVVRTLFGTVALSIATDLLAFLPPLTLDPLLASFYGGILSGVGIGITLKWRGSTGGTDLAAALVHRSLKTSVGQALLCIDFGIILLAGIAFRSAELALYALITLFLTSRTIDVVQEGMIYAKAAYIISDRTEEIARRVLHELGRGATILQGWGAYTGQERRVLLVIVARSEIAQLKEIVLTQDPRAFVVISEAHEVLGEGFKLEATGG